MTHLETRIGDPLLEQCISHLHQMIGIVVKNWKITIIDRRCLSQITSQISPTQDKSKTCYFWKGKFYDNMISKYNIHPSKKKIRWK